MCCRLTSELRLAHATDIDSANAVLRKFITDYNRRFALRPRYQALDGRVALYGGDTRLEHVAIQG